MKTYRQDREGLDGLKVPTDMDIAWAAGIYEGEGCCVQAGRKSGSPQRSFAIAVTQKDPELLYRLRDLFGGSVHERENERTTNIFKGHRTIFDWRVCGDRARLFIASIYPHLTARRKSQIDNTSAREFLDFVGELPQSTHVACDVHTQLTEIVKDYVVAHREFAKEKRRMYMQSYDQQDGPKTRRRLYMRELRKKHTVDTKKETPNVVKFG